MTTLREAATLALEALYSVLDSYGEPLDRLSISGGPYEALQCRDAITSLKAALAEPQIWVCPEAADTHRYDKPGHCEDCGNTLVQIK